MQQADSQPENLTQAADFTAEPAIRIPVIEEQVQISKKIVETGKIRISKRVYEEEVTVDVPVTRETHTVERVPVNQYVETAPEIRQEGDTMIIPVMREEVVVSTRLILVEELRLTKRRKETPATRQVTLRKEEVTVERTTDNLPDSDLT